MNRIPVLDFIDCTPEQIADRIEEMMRGNMMAREVVVQTRSGETVLGTFERVSGQAVEVEVNAASQMLRRVPCADIAKFGEYVPPLNRDDEVRG